MKNIFKNLWEELENSNNLPTRARKIISLDYSIFANKIDSNDQNFAKDITNSLMLGDVFILKGAFSKEFFYSLNFL